MKRSIHLLLAAAAFAADEPLRLPRLARPQVMKTQKGSRA